MRSGYIQTILRWGFMLTAINKPFRKTRKLDPLWKVYFLSKLVLELCLFTEYKAFHKLRNLMKNKEEVYERSY